MKGAKKLIAYAFSILTCMSGISQKKAVQDTQLLSPKAFNIFFNKLFSQLATGQSHSADLANHAAADLTNGMFQVNGFMPILYKDDTAANKISFLSFRFKGGLINENATLLFADKKLNSDVGLDLKYHFKSSNEGITYLRNEKRKVWDLKDQLVLQNEKAVYKVRLQHLDKWLDNQILNYDRQIVAIKSKYEKTELEFMEIATRLDAINNTSDSFRTVLRVLPGDSLRIKDSLSRYRDSLMIFIDSSDKVIKKLDNIRNIRFDIEAKKDSIYFLKTKRIKTADLLTKSLADDMEKKILQAELNAKILTARISWFTIAVSLNNRAYFTFYDSLPFENQIKRNELLSLNVGLEWNYYWQEIKSNKSHYFNIGIQKRRFNDLEDYSTTDVEQERNIVVGDTKKKILKKYKAYTDIIQDFRSWLIYTNYYFTFGEKSVTGFHFFPELDIRGNNTNRLNLGIGAVASFKDEKKDKSIINLEAYCKFLDVSNQKKTDDNFYQRVEIGVRLGVPIKLFTIQ